MLNTCKYLGCALVGLMEDDSRVSDGRTPELLALCGDYLRRSRDMLLPKNIALASSVIRLRLLCYLVGSTGRRLFSYLLI